MKKTMTKAEARELLLNSYTIIGDHDQEEIFSLYERITGQNREHPLPFGHEDCVAIFNGNLDTWGSKEFSFRNRKPISFEELKSIEIVDEPDYEQKFRECFALLEELYNKRSDDHGFMLRMKIKAFIEANKPIPKSK